MSFQNQRNPVLPLDIHVPDCEARVMPDGKLYIYGSFDNREDVFCSEEYHVISTPDMKEWTVHDISLKGGDIPWFNNPDAPKYPGIDWSHPTPFILKMLTEHPEDKEAFEKEDDGPKPALLFAPDCIEKNGKYYLYFCMSDDSEGVAVSDRPEGPFSRPVQLPCGGIDPSVFIDDDGQAYLYWGQLFSHGVKLNDDMMSFDREAIVDDLVTEEKHFFHEGSSMRKIGENYYYLYCDMERGKPTSLGYSMGKSPLGPFEYKGIIIDNDGCDPASWNNHGSLQYFQGQWYIFYHRCSRGVQQHRRLCIEPVTINPDGTIDEVKMTSQGTGQPFAPGESIMGYQACGMTGTVYIGVNEDADTKTLYPEKLMNISDGDTAVFRYVKSDISWSALALRGKGRGTVKVLLNGSMAGVQEIGNAVPESTDVAGKIWSARIPLSAEAGEYELGLVFEKSDGLEVLELILQAQQEGEER